MLTTTNERLAPTNAHGRTTLITRLRSKRRATTVIHSIMAQSPRGTTSAQRNPLCDAIQTWKTSSPTRMRVATE